MDEFDRRSSAQARAESMTELFGLLDRRSEVRALLSKIVGFGTC